MPIQEIIALSALILTGVFVAHPGDFVDQVQKIEYSILKETARVDNWDQPSLFETDKSIQRLHKIQTKYTRLR
jgi:hypothetical protein